MVEIKLMIVGDVHGQAKHLTYKLELAREFGVQHVLQVGDLGLWPGFDGVQFLDEVQESAARNGLTVYAIPGNHEWHDEWEHVVKTAATSRGFAMVRSRIALAPKAHHWKWAGKRFIAAGGAVSVDREYRLQREAGTYYDPISGRTPKATGPRTMYWPNEELQASDVNTIKSWDLRADYLITHDCSNYTPFYSRLKDDPETEEHRRRIDDVIRATKPTMHFHGHMHTKYDWKNSLSHGMAFETQTYGLECDRDPDSWGVLNTETNTFSWRGVNDLV